MGELIDGLYSKLELLMSYLILLNHAGHINNLYNTCFWCLVQQSGLSADQAEERLNVSKADKSINYFFHFLSGSPLITSKQDALSSKFSEKSINNKDMCICIFHNKSSILPFSNTEIALFVFQLIYVQRIDMNYMFSNILQESDVESSR